MSPKNLTCLTKLSISLNNKMTKFKQRKNHFSKIILAIMPKHKDAIQVLTIPHFGKKIIRGTIILIKIKVLKRSEEKKIINRRKVFTMQILFINFEIFTRILDDFQIP